MIYSAPDERTVTTLSEQIERMRVRDHVRSLLQEAVIAQAVIAGVSLGLPDALARGAADAKTAASRLDARPGPINILLHAWLALGLIHVEDGLYSLTAAGGMLRSGRAEWALARALDTPVWNALGSLPYALRTGKPAFDAIFGESYYAYLEGHPDRAHAFHTWRGLAGHAWIEWVVGAVDWQGTVADVGGGNGAFLAALLTHRRDRRGVLVDMPAAVQEAERVVGDIPTCTVLAADFFRELPTASIHVLAHVLLNWDDERAHALLSFCRERLEPDGRVVIVDVIGTGPESTWLNDLTLLALFGAHQRTEDEFRCLLREAGLEMMRVERAPADPVLFLIEARPV